MEKKLGVTKSGVSNHKEPNVFIPPKEDDVESINLQCKLSCVKKLFDQLRCKALDSLKSCRCVCPSGPGPFPLIWTRIDDLADPFYGDLDQLNILIENQLGDVENPEWHCGVNHTRICPKKLKKKITAFRCVIQQGVIDVMVNQLLLPKKGLNILDSMFNQLWEYGEKGPTLELPTWCL